MAWDPEAAWQQAGRGLGLAEIARTIDLPAEPLRTAHWPAWLPEPIRSQARAEGIFTPYQHQTAAADAAWQGSDVALATGTASGKSLAYLMPVLAALGDDVALPSTALYLAPTKALAHDQLRRLAAFELPGLRVADYDGDTPPEQRRWARRHATVVVSNPDMVHAGMLPNHAAWQSFLKRLRFIVLDEFHVYRGLFGANLSAVLRRLLRLTDHYGGSPVVIGTSATVADPALTLGALTGRPAHPVTGPTASRSATRLVCVPPGTESAAGAQRSTGLVRKAAAVLSGLVAQDVRTLCFVRSRKAAEAVTTMAAKDLAPLGMAHRVAAYRSGYLPEERRELERGLRAGDYLGMAATSALELGIDVSGLDAVIVAGWPGSRAALRQRLGRAGRAGRPALAVFLADEDPLDAFLVRNPDRILAGLEGLVIDTDNPYVLGPHLCAAAAELPLTDQDAERAFGGTGAALLPALGERGLLRRRPAGWYWTRSDKATDLADLRGIAGAPVSVVESGTGRVVGAVDAASADRTVHPGAIYTHRGEDYLVADLDRDGGVATAAPVSLPYSTQALQVNDTRVRQVLDDRRWGAVGLAYGIVDVSSRVTSFLRRRAGTGDAIGVEPLDMPVRTLRTKAAWWTIPDDLLRTAGIAPDSVAGAAHAAEHAAIGLLPLFANCDRWDIGGLSTPHHPDTGACTIMIHDGLPGGAGFAQRGFAAAASWWQSTLRAVADCECGSGCPSCVHSPKCGNGNEPLDKSAAIALIRAMLGDASPDAP